MPGHKRSRTHDRLGKGRHRIQVSIAAASTTTELFLPDRPGTIYIVSTRRAGERLVAGQIRSQLYGLAGTYGEGKIYLSSVHGYFHVLDANNKGQTNFSKALPTSRSRRLMLKSKAPLRSPMDASTSVRPRNFIAWGEVQQDRRGVATPTQPAIRNFRESDRRDPAHLQVIPSRGHAFRAGEQRRLRRPSYSTRMVNSSASTPIELKLAAMKPGPGLGQRRDTSCAYKGKVAGASFTAPKIAGAARCGTLKSRPPVTSKRPSGCVKYPTSALSAKTSRPQDPGLVPGRMDQHAAAVTSPRNLTDGNTVLDEDGPDCRAVLSAMVCVYRNAGHGGVHDLSGRDGRDKCVTTYPTWV